MNADKIVAEARLIVNKLRHDGADHIADTIDALLKLHDEGRWIPVSERMPPAHSRVLFICDGEIDIGSRCHSDSAFFESETRRDRDGCSESVLVDYWRDLPAPPAPQPARAGDGGKEIG